MNIHGELVGVNVAIRAGAQGIGFAIPVDTMITRVGQMMARVRTSGDLAPVGLHLRDEVPGSADTAQGRRRNAPTGASDKAGLKKGDVVIKVGDQRVASSLDFERALLDRTAGQSVEVVVRRDGSEQRLNLPLSAAPAATSTP